MLTAALGFVEQSIGLCSHNYVSAAQYAHRYYHNCTKCVPCSGS